MIKKILRSERPSFQAFPQVIDIFILSPMISGVILGSMGGLMKYMSENGDGDLEAMLEKVNIDDAFAKTVGMRVVELSPGYAKALIHITDDHINLFRMAHGGAIFCVADHACEAAGNSFGKPAVAIQNNIHFLSAGRPGDRLEATARVVHRARRIGLVEAVVRNQREEILAQCHQVIYFKAT
jgi:acyl-CoA thioesterase